MQKFNLRPFELGEHEWKVYGEIEIVDDIVRVQYNITGDLEQIDWPEVKSDPMRRWGLWEDTCLELFVGQAGDEKNYIELNFSPSGDWNGFVFTSYREKQEDLRVISDLRLQAQKAEARLQQNVEFSRLLLNDYVGDGAWRVGISAVIKTKTGEKYYYALKHASERPDFHQKEHFCIELQA